LDDAICHHLPSCAQCVTRFLQSLLDIWTTLNNCIPLGWWKVVMGVR
jgi:hypothetical protein